MAAFPVPEVSVVPGSWTVQRITTITTSQGTMQQTEHTYSTSVTRGVSDSIANSVTWNKWQEVSHAVSQPLSAASAAEARARTVRLLREIRPLERELRSPHLTHQARLRIGKRLARLRAEFGISLPSWNDVKKFGAKWAPTAGKLVGATAAYTISAAADVCPPTILLCYPAKGVGQVASKFGDRLTDSALDDIFGPNQAQQAGAGTTYNITNNNGLSDQQLGAIGSTLDAGFQGIATGLNGVQYALNQQGQLISAGLDKVAFAISAPRVTDTTTNGDSWGGSQTTTHTESEDHTITNGEAFADGKTWSTASAVDSSKAAELSFNYSVKNAGSDVLRQVTGLVFNVYLGNDVNPIVSYPAWQQFPNGALENLLPGQSETFSSNSGNGAQTIYLTLDQMKRIDLGEKLRVVLENYSYGDDQLFYEDALNAGITIDLNDGIDDGDGPVHSYVIPTWTAESVQDALARFFTLAVDSNGLMNAMWAPQLNANSPPTWVEHYLSDISWWTLYLTQTDAGNTQLASLDAQAGSSLLFQFDRDSDRDGYSDRIEQQYGTDPSNPRSHPNPEVLGGYVCNPPDGTASVGQTVTCKLAMANTGTYAVDGVQTTMYAPNNTTTMNDNVVGGNGVVQPGQDIAVGSLVEPPDLTHWQSTIGATPYIAGDYSGATDFTYTFTVTNGGTIGQGNTAMQWTDASG